jgi:hypothetical protein
MSGPFGSSQWMYASGGFYNGVATQSLRLNPADTLTKTYTTPTSSTTMSFGGWVKRQKTGKYSNLYSGSLGGAGVPQGFIYFNNTNDKLECFSYTGSSYVFNYATTRVFRDVGSWYHLWVAIDTTDATQADRVKIYVNGIRETSFSTETQVASGSPNVRALNESGITQYFGHTNSFYGGDVYYSDWYFIDGSAVSPVDTVGEFKNGVFIAKIYSPTFGNNGWHLEFNQTGTGTGSSSTIGADTSGNDNHFSSSGIVASDCDMPDSPENNWCTLNPLWYPAGTLSEGNLKFIPTVSSDTGTVSTFVPTGKSYWEVYIVSGTASSLYLGLVKTSAISNNYNTSSADWVISYGNGQYRKYGTLTSGQTTWGASDILGLAYDTEATTLYVYKNNALISTITGLEDVEHYVLIAGNTTSEAMVANFGQDSSFAGNETAQGNTDANGIGDFYYSPPSGYLALCTANLPEPTISPNADTQADDYFNTVTYSGTGDSNSQSITGVGFQPDFLWIKTRSTTYYHYLFDVVRGSGTNHLYSNTTETEGTWSNNATLTSYDSDGFTVGATPAYTNGLNNGSQTFVAWNWKAGGTAVSNTDGSITSSVSANTDAGFSIVSYTGTGGTATVGHGLGVKPSMLIVKPRVTANDWIVYHETLGAGKFITLNNTDGESSNTTMFNNTEPTTTVFSINTPAGTFLNKSGEPYVCYAFNSVEGYSKFGSYTGNGSTDGTFVYTGFRPAFIIFKNTSSGSTNWIIKDTVRDTSNQMDIGLEANTSDAEESSLASVDFLSNGMKIRSTGSFSNTSGDSYIYMAFAEVPFKYANAR